MYTYGEGRGAHLHNINADPGGSEELLVENPEVNVIATRCPPRPANGPATGDRQPATGSKLHKIIELLISQVLYKQSCV